MFLKFFNCSVQIIHHTVRTCSTDMITREVDSVIQYAENSCRTPNKDTFRAKNVRLWPCLNLLCKNETRQFHRSFSSYEDHSKPFIQSYRTELFLLFEQTHMLQGECFTIKTKLCIFEVQFIHIVNFLVLYIKTTKIFYCNSDDPNFIVWIICAESCFMYLLIDDTAEGYTQ